MTASMVERVARAVFVSNFHPDDVSSGTANDKWDEWGQDRDRAFRNARAAMEAMRDPDEGIVEAVEMLSYGEPVEGYRVDAAKLFTGMIDAALQCRTDGGSTPGMTPNPTLLQEGKKP